MVIAVVAVVFVGPKDLPGMLRAFGRFSRKVRGIAGDFQRQVDDALREAELDQVRDSINDVRSLSPRKMATDYLKGDDIRDELDDVRSSFDEAKSPDMEEPVTVDVDAALERQKRLDAAAADSAAKPAASGRNAVPGFASASDASDGETAGKPPKVEA